MPFIDLNIGGGPGVTPGDATVTFTAITPSSVAAGDVVYISGDAVGGLHQVDKVDIFTTTKMAAVGVVTQKLTSTTGIVMCAGEVSGLYTGLTPNAILFPDASSRLSETAPGSPAVGIVNVQPMAHVLTSDTIFIRVEVPTRRVSN